jgi:hypothetical protein
VGDAVAGVEDDARRSAGGVQAQHSLEKANGASYGVLFYFIYFFWGGGP